MNPPIHTLHNINITITLLAPWLVHGNDPGSYGLDAVQLRGPDGKSRVLPGTLVAGRIRDAWRTLRSDFGLTDLPDDLAWFGAAADTNAAEDTQTPAPGARGGRRRPHRSRFHVDDLVEADPPPAYAPQVSTRVAIDTNSGAAHDGMLLAVEQLELPGTPIEFKGTWRAWLTDAEAPTLARHLTKALQWQTQLGAERSVGFGSLHRAKVEVKRAASAPFSAKAAPLKTGQPGATRGLRLRFTQPLAVANRLISGNLFKSGDVIPGAAIKGALAHGLRLSGQPIPPWFDALRITHALPCSGDKRPAPLPLSLVAGLDTAGRDCIWDLAWGDHPAPLDPTGRAVRFQPDWKDKHYQLASAGQGWGRTGRHLRVRTAIEHGQAKEGQLFAYDCVTAAENMHWQTTLDLPPNAVQNEAAAWCDIAALLQSGPLGPIGKTDAFAQVEWLDEVSPVWGPGTTQVCAGDEVTVLLVSPALLFTTTAVLRHTSAGLLDPQPPVDLDAALRKAFAEAACATPAGQAAATADALTLLCHFSRQTMVGGSYLEKRFGLSAPAAGGKPTDYLPQFLVDAGSVFVFKVSDGPRASAVLAHWQRHGLPLGHSVVEAYTNHWQHNPWLPQNGYGEVLVNPQTGFAAS